LRLSEWEVSLVAADGLGKRHVCGLATKGTESSGDLEVQFILYSSLALIIGEDGLTFTDCGAFYKSDAFSKDMDWISK